MIVNQLDFVAADVDQLLGFYMQRSDRQEAILGELVAGIEEVAVGFLGLAHRSPMMYLSDPSGLVLITFLDSLVMPQPTIGSMLNTGMRLRLRPEGAPVMRASPEWPPLEKM